MNAVERPRVQTVRHRGSIDALAASGAKARRSSTRALPLAIALILTATARASAPPAWPAWAVAVLPSGAEFSLEVAADPASRERGYMFRERVGEREGMIFVFDQPDRHSFWMKNCRVSLDIVWLDSAFRIVDIAHDRKPCPERGDCPSVQPAAPARYALEFAGGTAKREGLERGDAIAVIAERSPR
jgi:hypothetical protein